MLKQALKGINHPVFLRDHGQSKSTYNLIYGDKPFKLHEVNCQEENLGMPSTSF